MSGIILLPAFHCPSACLPSLLQTIAKVLLKVVQQVGLVSPQEQAGAMAAMQAALAQKRARLGVQV